MLVVAASPAERSRPTWSQLSFRVFWFLISHCPPQDTTLRAGRYNRGIKSCNIANLKLHNYTSLYLFLNSSFRTRLKTRSWGIMYVIVAMSFEFLLEYLSLNVKVFTQIEMLLRFVWLDLRLKFLSWDLKERSQSRYNILAADIMKGDKAHSAPPICLTQHKSGDYCEKSGLDSILLLQISAHSGPTIRLCLIGLDTLPMCMEHNTNC